MELLLPPKKPVAADNPEVVVTPGERVRAVLFSWEIYPILFVAAFLRLFNIDKVVFSQDESDVFQLARDTIVHGLLPLTSNRASIGDLNPPLVIYFFLPTASLSANPLWGNVMVAVLSTAAVLLTYFFTRRYYGRLAGTIAASLFATSVGVWLYSRNIWSPSLEPFFVMLFIWFLFLGVVERRKGWLFPALVLLGVLYQLHGSSLYLCIPLLAAVFFAFKTIHLRDITFAVLGLLLLFAPFIFWEFHSGFSDVKSMLTTSQHQASYDFGVLRNYLFFIHPTLVNPYTTIYARDRDNHLLFPNSQSILVSTPLHSFHILLQGAYILAAVFLFAGIVLTAVLVLFPQRSGAATAISTMVAKQGLVRWWADFQVTPRRQGLTLLLLWQVAPLALSIRHSIILFDHYFLFLLPGEFILIALAIEQSIIFLQKQRPEWRRWIRSGMSGLATLIILAQLIGCGSTLIDLTTGNLDGLSVHPNFVDLHSQQNALQEADQLALRRGIRRIYTTLSYDTARTMQYLSEQIKTPIELNEVSDLHHVESCFVLPDPSAGPVVFLAEPNNPITDIMLSQYTNATLIEEPPHLGGAPYKLYILTAKLASTVLPHTFDRGLQLISPAAYVLPGTRLLTTRWQILDILQPASRTNYNFSFQVQFGNSSITTNCQPTATWAGDQLFAFQDLGAQSKVPSQITMQASTFTSKPTLIQAGPLTTTIFYDTDTPSQSLLTADQKRSITLPVVTTP
jgi:4-amino-4-deoxy-L-arabinose transferase-like glycosyltransferase